MIIYRPIYIATGIDDKSTVIHESISSVYKMCIYCVFKKFVLRFLLLLQIKLNYRGYIDKIWKKYENVSNSHRKRILMWIVVLSVHNKCI